MSIVSSYRRYTSLTVLACALGFGATANATIDVGGINLHGFATQGYLYNNGDNRIYGDSPDGSFDYHEIGLGGRYQLNQYLSFAGQLLARDAGHTDDNKIRTDYLYMGLQVAQSGSSGMNLRLGRVRNPLGFYNATRDVLFTRPTVLLPQMYSDTIGIRELLFSSDGIQLFGYWDHGDNTTSFTGTFGLNTDLSSQVINNLLPAGSSGISLEASMENPIFAQLLHTRSGGTWKFGLSILNTTLEVNAPSLFLAGTLDANFAILSIQRNFAKLSLTSEYSLVTTSQHFGVPFGGHNNSDSVYLQAEYRFSQQWTGIARIDEYIGDRNHRSQTDSQDLTLGVRWNPLSYLQISAEFHGLRGTANIPPADNVNAILDDRTELFVMMAGLKF